MSRQNIIIPHPKELDLKEKRFIKDGADSFHMVSDFDRTLTKAFVNEKNTPSLIAQMREHGYLGKEYVKKAFELRDIYRPIEISDIPVAEKCPKMVEWWQKHLNLLVKYGMNKDVIKDIIKKESIKLRDGASEFLDMLAKNKIPLLIFSASVGDMIKEYLISEKALHKNIHIISNFFRYKKDGKVLGYKDSIIHTFNKNEVAVKNTPYYEDIKSRKNVMLLCDTIGDLGMSEGLEHKNIIKIGFLNQETNHLLEDYKKYFDVIILNDGSMDYVNTLVKNIVKCA